MPRSVIAVCALVLALALPAGAHAAATVTGKVTDAGTGQAVAGITVTVFVDSQQYPTTTAVDGTYSVTPPGAGGDASVLLSSTAGCACHNYRSFNIGHIALPASGTYPLDGTVQEGGGVIATIHSGSVSGPPIQGVKLQVGAGGAGTSDADGKLVLRALPAGTTTGFLIPPDSGPYSESIQQQVSVTIVAHQDGTADFALAPGGVVAGSIVDDLTGAPIANATVGVTGADASGRTAADGSYAIHHVALSDSASVLVSAAPYYFGAQQQSVVVKAQQTTTVALKLEQGGLITGTLTDADTGAPINTTVNGFSGDSFYDGALVYVDQAFFITQGAGTYTTSLLHVGQHPVRPADVGKPSGYTMPAAVNVNVVAGQTAHQDFQLKRAGVAPAPTPGPTPAPGPTPPPAKDTTAPKATVTAPAQKTVAKALAAKALTFTVASPEPATIKVAVTTKLALTGKKQQTVTLASGSVKLTKAGSKALKLKFNPSAKVRKAIKGKRLKLTITQTATDAAGNVSRKTKSVTLSG